MNALRKLLFTSLLLLVASPALAQDADATPTVGEIARMRTEVSNEIYSPFCPGKTLAMCTSPNAAAVRRDIQDLARDGKDKETIKNEIVARYGEEFRFTEPPAQDNAALGGVIVVAFILAAFAVVMFSRRKLTTRSEQGMEHTSMDQGSKDQDDLSDEERDYLDDVRAHVQS